MPKRPNDSLPPAADVARCYVRVSDVHGRSGPGNKNEFVSPDLQVEAGDMLSRLNSWEFDEEASRRLIDLDQSGFKKTWQKRPGIMGHLEDARKGLFNRLIFYKIARIGRNAREGLEIWDAFEKAGVTIHSVKESIDSSTPVGRFMRTMLLAVAEMESEDKRQYAADIHARRARAGKPPANSPAWITKDGHGGYMIDEKNAPIFRRMIELRIGGMGYTPIARMLNDEGLIGAFGAKWTSNRLAQQFQYDRIERFAGTAVYNLMDGSAIDLPGAYPAIADEDEMATLRSIGEATRQTMEQTMGPNALKGNRTRGASLTTVNLLSTRIFCAVCGNRLSATSAGVASATNPKRGYRCLKSLTDRDTHPNGNQVFVAAEPAEEAVIRVIRYALANPPAPAPVMKKQPKLKTESTPSSEEAIKAVRRKMSDLVGMRLSEKIDLDIYNAHYDALKEQLDALMDAGEASEGAETIMSEETRAEALDALETGNYRWLVLSQVSRIDTPVELEGVEYVAAGHLSKGGRKGNGRARRCVHVTLRWPAADGQVFVAPIYRKHFIGSRTVHTVDGNVVYAIPGVDDAISEAKRHKRKKPESEDSGLSTD